MSSSQNSAVPKLLNSASKLRKSKSASSSLMLSLTSYSHAQELAVLSRLVGSPLFPSLFGAGFVGSFPVLVMRYIPPPYKMCLDLWCASDDIQDVVKEGIRAAVETMKGLGMRHTDWKAENVLYHPESGYVAVVDLKGVETWEGGSGEEEEEEEEVEVAWKNIMEVG